MQTLEVRLDWGGQETSVGTLASDAGRIFFEYSPSFLAAPLPVSPFKLPVRPGVFEHTDLEFGPLFGAFDDSLPDSWGLLLMDREFKRRRRGRSSISVLDRLAYIGTRGMGALRITPPPMQIRMPRQSWISPSWRGRRNECWRVIPPTFFPS